MSKIYLIGGAPRVGKSTAIRELIKQKPMFAASTDAIRATAKGLVTAEENPKLFKAARGVFGSDKHIERMRNQPEKVLEHELGEAEETWKSVIDFISYYQREGKDAAIEGVGVLPKQLSEVDFNFKAVFIVNLTDQTDTILEYAKEDPGDWTNKYDDNTIKLYCKFNKLWNSYYAEEARKYKLPIVEVDSNNFQHCIKQAVDVLLG